MPTWADLGNVWKDPMFQFGLGMLASNQGPSGGQAFQRALGGGLSAVMGGQSTVSEIERQQAATALAQQQQQQRAMKLEQQRRLAAAAPQLAPAILSRDPSVQRQAAEGIFSIYPEALPGLGMALAGQQPAEQWGTLTAEEASALGFKPGTVAQRSTTTGQLRVPGAPGVSLTTITGGEAAKAAQAETALSVGRELERLISTGAVNPTGIAGLWTSFRDRPTVGGAIARLADDLSEDESRAVQLSEMLSQQLIQAMRGASVGPEEEEKFKRSLPVFGKPNFAANLRTTLNNITELENKRRSLRGQPAIAAPAQQPGTSPNIRILGIRRID